MASSSPPGRPTTRSTEPAEGPLLAASASPTSRACASATRRAPKLPRRRDAAASASASAAAAPRPLDRQAGAEMGRDRGARLDPAQLPRLRRLRPAAGLQALRRSEVDPARQPAACCPARRRSSSSAPTPARPTPRSRARRPLAGVLRTAGARRRPPRRMLGRRIPRRHADADPRRRRRLPQTLDPARQLRRNPRPEPAEDQRRLRLRRRRGADRSGRRLPRDRDRPRRDRRLHRLRRPDRRGRRGRRSTSRTSSAPTSPAAPAAARAASPCACARARTRSTAKRR